MLVASVLRPGAPDTGLLPLSPLSVALAHDVVILNVSFYRIEDENKATFSPVAYGVSEG